MTREEKQTVLHCLKSMIDEEVCEECPLYGTTGTDHCEKDCVRLAINALEQVPCTDAISMDKTIVQLSHLLSDWDDDWNVAIRKCIETVKIVPPVTAEKVGQWIEHFDESGKWYECDQCHTDWDSPVNYCPNCGSKM